MAESTGKRDGQAVASSPLDFKEEATATFSAL
jgi:hypothetical protein